MEFALCRSEPSNKETILEHNATHEGHAGLMERIDDLLSEVRNTSVSGAPYNAQNECHSVLARKLYLSRRKIDECFEMVGFATSPAWDIMLDLFHNEEKGKSVSITSACIGAACASTTALRWLEVLVSRSLIERNEDPKDRRRSYVALTVRGRNATMKALKAHVSL